MPQYLIEHVLQRIRVMPLFGFDHEPGSVTLEDLVCPSQDLEFMPLDVNLDETDGRKIVSRCVCVQRRHINLCFLGSGLPALLNIRLDR
jgi:hypothetical protein